MSMAFRVERIDNDILIRKIMRVKRRRDLPEEYLKSRPYYFMWNDGHGTTLITLSDTGKIEDVGLEIHEGDCFSEPTFNKIIEEIKKAGDNLHEIMIKKPKKQGNVWTVVI